MKRLIRILSGVLFIQLALVVILTFSGGDTGAFASKDSLLELKLTGVDKITIEEKDKPALVLDKQGEYWQMPGYFGFPSRSGKVRESDGQTFRDH